MRLRHRAGRLRARHTVVLEVIGVIPIVGLVAACGASGAMPASVKKPGTTATTTASTPAATASPTPAPPPPVVMIEQQNGASGAAVLQAMDPSGTPLWSVPYAKAPDIFTSGPRIFEADYTANKVSVFDRSGHPVGNGVLGTNRWGRVVFSPTSAEWAWPSDDGVSPSPLPASGNATHRGSFWVAGVGEAPHKVYSWTETDAADSVLYLVDQLQAWSDEGLVSSQAPSWAGCSNGHQSGSYVVNAATGARTDLGSNPVTDVHAGVIVGSLVTDQTAVVLSGRTSFTWSNTAAGYTIEGTYVSPAGDLVAVPMINTACAGIHPKVETALISVGDHSVRFVADASARGWLDDTHLVAQVNLDTTQATGELDIVGLDGTRSLLGHGNFVGVLTSS